jgi:hypothetical protein
MTWEIASALGGLAFTLVNLANIFLTHRLRGDLAELKLSLVQTVAKDKEDLRTWTENQFARRETVDDLKVRVDAFRLRA